MILLHNNPSTATRFTLDGPVVCSKITLECRSCSIRYDICNFTDSSGIRYYPPHLCSNVVEVSNITYFDLNLYRWIPSLRYCLWFCCLDICILIYFLIYIIIFLLSGLAIYDCVIEVSLYLMSFYYFFIILSNHCWVSFSGFSEAYNEVYEQEITECGRQGVKASMSVKTGIKEPLFLTSRSKCSYITSCVQHWSFTILTHFKHQRLLTKCEQNVAVFSIATFHRSNHRIRLKHVSFDDLNKGIKIFQFRPQANLHIFRTTFAVCKQYITIYTCVRPIKKRK
jgi:hypothetical protein